MNDKRFTWLISPKSFIMLLGAEYEIMKQAGSNVLLKFYISAVTIFIIMIISFISVRYAIELLFHNTLIEIFLSVFLSLLFVLMYIFLINTFSKKHMHEEDDDQNSGKEKNKKYAWNFSNVSRIGFVIFMGFMLSKPLEIMKLSVPLLSDVQMYKSGLMQNHAEKINSLYVTEENKLHQKVARLQQINTDHQLDSEIRDINNKLIALNNQKLTLSSLANYRINKSSFFVFQIQTATRKYKISWLICMIVILIFLLPGYLIYSISKNDEYFKMKSSREKLLVENAYQAFIKKYVSIFREEYNADVSFNTVYLNPPFNTRRKSDHTYKSSKDFFSKFSSH